MTSLQRNIINAILFQLGWLICVISTNTWAVISTSLILIIHFKYIQRTYTEWRIFVIALLIGFIFDTLLLQADILVTPNEQIFQPIWLTCLWALFASTIGHSLAWLRQRIALSAFIGAIFGPLAYKSGAYLVGIQLDLSVLLHLITLSLGWAIIFPVLLLFYTKYIEA